MKILIVVVQWIVIIAIGAALWYGWSLKLPTFPTMPGYQVLFFALAIAFAWVEVLKWGVTKPFNCVKCMTGWVALLLAVILHTPFWYLYLPAGLFVGAIYSAVKMRWL